MSDIIQCPQCDRKLRVPESLRGKAVKCPTCGATFAAETDIVEAEEQPAVDMPARRPAPPPEDFKVEAPVRRRAPTEEPGGDYDEDAWDEDFEPEENRAGRPRRRRRRGGRALDSLSNDYAIDIGEWFNYAKANYTAVLGPIIGYVFIYLIITLVLEFIPLVGPLVLLFLAPPLQAGFSIICLKQLKGEPWAFGDCFGGFNYYGALLGNFFLVLLMTIGCLLPAGVVFAVAGLSGSREMLIGAFVFLVMNYLGAIYVLIRATLFNVQFIVDHNCGPIEAIRASWTISRGHFWGLLGSTILVGLIIVLGYLACVVGVLFSLPFGLLALNAGYLLIGGTRSPRPSPEPQRRPPPERLHDAEDMD